jgi:magnesium transporter
VVDNADVLQGLVPIRRIISARRDTPLKDIMETEVVSVLTNVDQEEVARLVDVYNLAAIPVVNGQGRLQGVVTLDDVIDVIREEASEDVYRMAGTSAQHPISESPGRRFVFRLPWLLILVVAGLINSIILRYFGHTLETITAVTFFIPVIIAMAGNVSLQSSSIMVRGLATGEVIYGRFFKILLGELSTGLLIGLACGTFVAFGSSLLHFDSAKLSLAVGIALFFSISVAAVMGTVMPLMFHRLGVDPAVASGPFVTTLNDICGLVIYLSVATALLT